MKLLSAEAGHANRRCPCCAGAGAAAPVAQALQTLPMGCSKEALGAAPPVPVAPQLACELAAPPPQHLQSLELQSDVLACLGGRDAACKQSPPATPPAIPQPEEEADGPLPGAAATEELPQKSKLLAVEEAFGERAVVEGSRNSAISDVSQPAREPQPALESPRDPIAELSTSTDVPMPESPEGAVRSSHKRPSASGPEHEEGVTTEASVSGPEHEEPVTTEADSSMEADSFGDPSSSLEDAIEEAFTDYSAIRPSENGMDYTSTLLHNLEQQQLSRAIQIMVPEGMGPDREVTFEFENQKHKIAVPEGYLPGAQMQVSISNRPFLERSATQASRRGHNLNEFPERWCIMDSLRHCLRTTKEQSNLVNDEFKARYVLYTQLRGKAGTPLLPFTLEETPEDLVADD